jgi:hypothetical protein
VVICGDTMQLGPQIVSETARNFDLDSSLLSRLFESPFYSMHPRARQYLHSRRYSPSPISSSSTAAAAAGDVPFCNLTKNYRFVVVVVVLVFSTPRTKPPGLICSTDAT